jgi:hypothetical protein
MSEKVYLYVIGCLNGPVKVGISSSPYVRMMSFQTGCPLKLELLHAEPMRNRAHALLHERMFHDVYEQDRIQGEWFSLHPELAIEGIETSLDHEAHFESLR